jgi:hypothetical protein
VKELELKPAIRIFLEARAAAYPAASSIPQFHFMIHFPATLRKLGWVPNAMILERKHKSVKRYADALMNTSAGFDKSVLLEMPAKALHDLDTSEHLSMLLGLIDAKCPPKKIADFMANEFQVDAANCKYSKHARVSKWERVSAGDVVVLDVNGTRDIGKVWFFMCVHGDIGFFVSVCFSNGTHVPSC